MRYFGGKVGLLDAIFEEGWKHLNDRVVRAVSTAANAREALLDSINVVVAGLSRDADLATLFMYESRRVRGDDRRTSRGFSRFSENIRGLVRQAQAVRQIDPTLDTNAVTAAVLGATEAMIRERLVAKSGASRGFAEREIRRTLTAILDGFGAPAPPKTVAKRRR
jgi:AcrR family transcriptional regulator